MNNLKRVLSLGLAGTMLTGMMMVGAGAANKEFTDAEEITHVEAVNSMAALGVIAGKDTGAFDPDGIVTRAEMAKIICVMLSGGEDPTLGVKSTPTYSDIKGHWAESYIEYCSSIGIIAGQGDGTFNPDGTVTSSAAAKMFMVSLGYDSDVFGFTGLDWEINTNREASDAKLYEELKGIAVSEGMTRDNAAQMAYNALDAKVMEKTYDKVQSNGEISYNYVLSKTTSFLNKYFDAHTFIGTYMGNKDNGATSTTGEIQVVGKLDIADAAAANVTANFPSDMDISNIGEEIKIIFKDGKGGTSDKPDKRDTIYGVFNTGNTEVVEATKNDIGTLKTTDARIKIDGTEYDTTNSVTVYTNYVRTGAAKRANDGTSTSNSTLTAFLKAQSADKIKFVMDDNGKIYAAYVTEVYTARVTGVTSSKVTLSNVGAINIDDNDIYEGVAKDDVVVYTRFYDNSDKDKAFFTLTKAETVEGELKGYKVDGSTSPANQLTNLTVDGTTYKVNEPPVNTNGLTALTEDAITKLGTGTATDDGKIGDTVRLYLVDGMVAAVQSLESTGGNYAVITDEDTTGTLGSSLSGWKATIMTSDGKETSYPIHKDSTKDGSTKLAAGDTALIAAGNLVEYSISGDKLKIKKIVVPAAITATDGPGNARVWDKETKLFTTTGTATAVAASDAVLYVGVDKAVADGTPDDFYAYNLRGVSHIANTSGTGISVAAITNSDGQVKAAYATLTGKPTGSTSDTLYGIVSNVVGAVTVKDEDYIRYTVAVGRDEDVVINTPDTLAKGTIVYFDESSDQCYNAGDIKPLIGAVASNGTVTGKAIAVKKYDESNRLLSYFLGTQYNAVSNAYDAYTSFSAPSTFTGLDVPNSVTADKDVKIVYVNADDSKNGDEIGVNQYDNSTGYANAIIFDQDGDGVIDVIVVESSGEKNLSNATGGFAYGAPVTSSINVPTINKTANTGKEGTYAARVNKSTANNGDTITVTVTCTALPAASSTDTITVTSASTVTGAAATLTTSPVTVTVAHNGSTGAVATATFVMPSNNVTDLVVNVSNDNG